MKISAFCLCWLLILTAPGVMAQQTAAPNQSWDALRQLQSGNEILVERKVRLARWKRRSGKMVSLSDTELVIEREGKTVSFRRDEVKKVWRFVPPSRYDKLAQAGGFGMLGVFLGMAATFMAECNDCEVEKVGAWVVIIATSALLGYFTASDKLALVYSAP
jgi:hypothetical protein